MKCTVYGGHDLGGLARKNGPELAKLEAREKRERLEKLEKLE